MTTLTMGMLEDAMRLLKTDTRIPDSIRVGSLLRFKAHLKSTGVEAIPADPRNAFHGMPVLVSHLVPDHMALIMAGGQVVSVIRLKPLPPPPQEQTHE